MCFKFHLYKINIHTIKEISISPRFQQHEVIKKCAHMFSWLRWKPKWQNPFWTNWKNSSISLCVCLYTKLQYIKCLILDDSLSPTSSCSDKNWKLFILVNSVCGLFKKWIELRRKEHSVWQRVQEHNRNLT